MNNAIIKKYTELSKKTIISPVCANCPQGTWSIAKIANDDDDNKFISNLQFYNYCENKKLALFCFCKLYNKQISDDTIIIDCQEYNELIEEKMAMK